MKEIINIIKENWLNSKKIYYNNNDLSFELSTEFSDQIAIIPKEYPFKIPQDLKDFWLSSKNADLFIEKEYGQWGLKILSPEDALKETIQEKKYRPEDYKNTDLIIGNFIGDSDKLVIDTDKTTFGRILISLSIDKRQDWFIASDTFKDFLFKYFKNNGNKFWEK